MATLVDELIVSLGLDTSKFTREQQAAVDSLKKFKTDAGKAAQDVEGGAKRMTEAFGGLERGLMRLGTVFLGFAGGIGFVTFLASVQKSIAELYRLGQQLGQSGRDLYAWQQVGAQVGATAEDITGSYRNMTRAINDYLAGTGQLNAYFRFFAQRGVQFTRNGVANTQTEIYSQLNRAVQGMDPQRSEAFLRNLGLGEGTVRMIQQSPEKFQADFARFRSRAPSADELKEAAIAQAKFNDAWSETLRLAVKLGNMALPAFNSAMKAIANIFEQAGKEIDNVTRVWDNFVDGLKAFDAWLSSTWIARWFMSHTNTASTGGAVAPPGADEPSGAPRRSVAPPGSDSGIGGGSELQRGGRGPLMIPPLPFGSSGNIPTPSGAGLAGDRQRFVKELQEKPWLREHILAVAAGENKNPNANLAVIESMMNRASVRGTSLEEAARRYNPATKTGYYAGYDPAGARNPRYRGMIEGNLEKALAGSNVSNYATDNASGWLAAKDRLTGAFRLQYEQGGESFFSPGRSGRGVAGRQQYEDWRRKMEESWGNNLRAIPWLQPNGMSIIKGIPSPTTNNSSTSETHIGQFTVMTEPRSNPWGTAAQIKEAVQRANIMSNSNSGPN